VRVVIRCRILDPRLQVAAGDVDGARKVARLELLGLAHVDDDRAVAQLALDVGGVDLVDLATDVADDLRSGGAHSKSPKCRSDFSLHKV